MNARKEDSLPPVTAARRLARRARSAALATVQRDGSGWPYTSLVTVAVDHDASPIFLLSRLAEHTQNLMADPRASLLIEEASGETNPQTGPRVTLLGRLEITGDDQMARRYLARQPGARLYAGFNDFNFYRMTVERVHVVSGFARANWVGGSAYRFDRVAATNLASCEAELIEDMNERHGDLLALFANRLLGRRGKAWRLIGIDPEGADLKLRSTFARIDFETPVRDSRSCRKAFHDLERRIRRNPSTGGT